MFIRILKTFTMFIRVNRNPKNTKHLPLSFFDSGTKLFITFLSLRFSTWEERDTISFYADFSIWPHHVQHPAANYWSDLSELRKSSCFVQAQISTNFLSNSKNPQPIASGDDVIHVPGPILYLGFLSWHLWLSHPPRAREHTHSVCAPN